MTEHRSSPPCSGRTTLSLLLPIGASIVAGAVANGFAPVLVTRHPLLLIALNPRLRYLILASPRLGPVPFFAVPFVRLWAIDVLTYLLGRWCGEATLAWIERRIGRARRPIRALQRWFARAGPVLAFAFPSGIVCLMAGSSGMPPVLFGALIAGGIILRLVGIRILASALRPELASALRFIARHQGPLLALTLLAGAIQLALVLRRPSRPGERHARGGRP